MNSKMNLKFLGSTFNNPVISLSGCYGFGLEFESFFDKNLLGGITLKGLTNEPRDGNYGNRIAETPSGILNCVGLENPGIDYFLSETYPILLKEISTNMIININGSTFEDYEILAAKLAEFDSVKFIELNLSCPNVKCGGMSMGTDHNVVYEITQKIKSLIGKKKLIVKLTPNVTNIQEIAKAAEKGGADAISLINTVLGMQIDIKNKKPLLGNTFGGLSGPAIFPIALRMVYQVYQVVKIPIIGMGGVSSTEDVIKMMMAGASLVGIGTLLLTNPSALENIINGIEQYCIENSIENISEIIGIAHDK
ncbi:MAG: dihydroorotate dehydrogenase [Mycoplasma sp.]